MLILSRYAGEQIDIGGGITVTVVEVRGDKVRLGFEAPEDVAIHRREVTERIASEGSTGRSRPTDGHS